ncbi:DUF445 domain-containing protein [Paenibacillus chungangensis]|uniref:DUF445 domain-containing protein n=1 Tax=Paenibacillus chungangensis TaxID=696535 RepID=A0ABW3HU22_9BACL
MKKQKIRAGANITLILSAAGILAAFPFQHTFAGGLLFAAFSAATIGGLADTFAINALFGDPLKVRWPKWMGTHIIARNRERLIDELVDMVENELLTVDAIKEHLQYHNLAEVVAQYLLRHGGSVNVKEMAEKLLGELLERTDAAKLARSIERFLSQHDDALQLSDMLADIGDWSIRNGYDDKTLSFLFRQLAKIAATPQLKVIIGQFVHSAIKAYEGDKFRRRLVDFTAGLNADAISEKAQIWIVTMLEGLADECHPQRTKLKEWLIETVKRLKDDEELRLRVEGTKRKLMDAIWPHISLQPYLSRTFDHFREALAQEGRADEEAFSVKMWLHRQLDAAMDQLKDAERLERLDAGLKSAVLTLLEQSHAAIGRTVRSKLNTYTNEDLIELVKEKAGHDLQFIRLNGIVVGALVGSILYMLTFWIGGV